MCLLIQVLYHPQLMSAEGARTWLHHFVVNVKESMWANAADFSQKHLLSPPPTPHPPFQLKEEIKYQLVVKMLLQRVV